MTTVIGTDRIEGHTENEMGSCRVASEYVAVSNTMLRLEYPEPDSILWDDINRESG